MNYQVFISIKNTVLLELIVKKIIEYDQSRHAPMDFMVFEVFPLLDIIYL